MYRSTVSLNVIDSPVVSGARHKRFGNANIERRLSLITFECIAGTGSNIIKIISEVYIL